MGTPAEGAKTLVSREDLLVQRCKRGEAGAFDELVRLYEKKVYNLAFRLSGNRDDAYDLAQEAFLRVYNAVRDFRGQSSFSTWLYRVVTNVCLDQLRSRARHPVTSLDEPLSTEKGELPRQITDDGLDPEEEIERLELKAAVQKGIDSLKGEYRTIIVLRDIQDLPYEDIADILNLSLGTVKSRLNRARLALRGILSDMELFREDDVRRAGISR